MTITAVLKSRLNEWLSTPTADVIRQVLRSELDRVHQERSDLFLPGKPQKTQEVRSNLIGQEAVLQDMINLLTVDHDSTEPYLEANGVKIVNDKSERDIPEWGSHLS